MPKRHNALQDLIAAIHEQMAAPHQVCESDMLVDRVSGREREVDIVIHTAIAGYEFVLSVECTSCGRPASVEWVEQMSCKHSSLPTNKLVLVSKAGFTASALAKAKFLGVECHSLDSASKVDWAKYVNRHSNIFLAAIDTVTVVVPFSPTYKLESPYKGIPMDTLFLDAQGKFHATAEGIAHAIIAKGNIAAATIDKMDVDSGGGWEIFLPMQSGVRMRLSNGNEHEVHELKVAFLANPLMVSFEMERAIFKDAQIAYGSHSNVKGDFLVTILEAEGSSVSAQVRVRRPWGEVQTYSLVDKTESTWSVASDEAMRALVGRTDNSKRATHDVAPSK